MKTKEESLNLLARAFENVRNMTEEDVEKAHLDVSELESAYNLGRASAANEQRPA